MGTQEFTLSQVLAFFQAHAAREQEISGTGEQVKLALIC